MTTIHFLDANDTRHTVNAKDGLTVMEALRPLDAGVDGECEGSLACATCHVWVEPSWIGLLGDKSEAEEDILDVTFLARASSRLCCQIKVGPELEGLEMSAPGRLVG